MKIVDIKKWIIAFMVFVIPFTQIVSYPVAYAANWSPVETADAAAIGPITPPNTPLTINDLVVLVVDEDLYVDRTSYIGLRNDFPGYGLSDATLEGRINRYAEDLVKTNEMTDTKLLFYDKDEDTVQSLIEALENLYINGSDGNGDNKLAGAVLIGDIPLPVVNKNGNRFVSMFPYTDFNDPAYLYSSATDSFDRNGFVSFPKAEIWHGVIQAPRAGVSGKEDLAMFFDKNHLYYEGYNEFANFEKKLFHSDLIYEDDTMLPESFARYLAYVDGMEDMAYQRYNKYWANGAFENVNEGLSETLEGAQFEEEGERFFEAVGLLEDKDGSNVAPDPMAMVPDIFSKNIIDQNLLPYYTVVKKYISTTNDWGESTGRYGFGEIDHVPGLITMKDEHTKGYLRIVNDALETEINDMAEAIQEPIPLLKYTKLAGETATGPFEILLYTEQPGGPLSRTVTHKTDGLLMRYPYFNEVNGKYYMSGVDLDTLDSPKQCSYYLGSTREDYYDSSGVYDPMRAGVADGEYSILARAMSMDNPGTALLKHTIGVNTRPLGPEDAYRLTGGATSSGSIVEDNFEYGIAAFAPNYLQTNYANPYDGIMNRGDVIVGVDGYAVNAINTLDKLVEDSYKRTLAVAENGGSKVGDLTIEHYSGGTYHMNLLKFTVNPDENSTTGSNSDGVIFTENLGPLGEEPGLGYVDSGFGNKAGCTYAMVIDNAGKAESDNCLETVAVEPVLDPGGGNALVSLNGEFGFPERDGKALDKNAQIPKEYLFGDIDEFFINSCYEGLPAIGDAENDRVILPMAQQGDDDDDVTMQFQGGGGQTFGGSTPSDDKFTIDSNPYGFPLDDDTKDPADDKLEKVYGFDYYGRWLQLIGHFVDYKGYRPDRSPDDYDVAKVASFRSVPCHQKGLDLKLSHQYRRHP